MKKLFIIIIIFISFQSWSKANDISDFEIEGVSVGDSLLDFLDKWDLTEQSIIDYPKNTYPGSKKFHGLRINRKSGEYDHFSALLKKGDKKYIIYILRGVKHFENNLIGCKKYKKKVVESFKELLSNIDPIDYIHKYRGDEESISYITAFNFKDGSTVRAYCDIWSASTKKEKRWVDALNIELSSAEGLDWINNEAYN